MGVADLIRYLYRAMLAMDANFRLKNQLVSSWSRDPAMGIGAAYFVARPGLEAYVKSRMHEDDVSPDLSLCGTIIDG